MAYITCCVSGADLKHKLFDLHGHFFFSFLSGGKNILKISEDIFGVVINLSVYLYHTKTKKP